MQLEVISRPADALRSLPPLVLVHGAWHGAWCWKDTFLGWFAANGWEVHALSLRGHGGSDGRDRLRWWSISDYVADLDRVVRSLDRHPVLVGHSMGGFIVQKYLENHAPAGAVLLASVPPSGIARSYGRVFKRYPMVAFKANLTLSPYAVIADPRHAREWFFSPAISDEELAAWHGRLQDESFRALLDMLAFDLPRPRSVRSHVAVLGAERDAMVSLDEVEATAEIYDADVKIFPGMAHNMMCEPHWQDVAEWIADWTRDRPAV